MWIIRVSPDGWRIADFEAGQYTALGVPGAFPRHDGKEESDVAPSKLVIRPYSIASSPLEKSYLEFYMVLVDDGDLSPRLFPLAVGSRVWLGPRIAGTFVLSRVPQEAELVFIATGTGVAPFVGMLRTLVPGGLRRPVALIHGVRHADELGYRDELVAMEKQSPLFHYIPTVSRPAVRSPQWKGHSGYVQQIWQSGVVEAAFGHAPSPDRTHIFLCGSPDMIDENITMLEDEGFSEHRAAAPGLLHVERYR